MTKFCDRTEIEVTAGNGGNGASHFRREKFIDKGGPDGGNGGPGGNIVFEADINLNTLIEFHTKKHFKAEDGENGHKSLMAGKTGEDLLLTVPVGTQIIDSHSKELLADLNLHGMRALIAKGGRGGMGNAHFKSSTNQVPTLAEKGDPGELRLLKLELKMVAEVGIIGIPSAGKSTLISVISNAKPKIADYPFTTLIPNLGVVSVNRFDKHSHDSFVVADIPGLIEGASQGKGLGFEFLRHTSRTKILVHLLDPTQGDITENYRIINKELSKYDKELKSKPQIVVINKADAYLEEEMAEIVKTFKKKTKITPLIISAASHAGLDELIFAIDKKLKEATPIISEPEAKTEEITIYKPGERMIKFEVKYRRTKIEADTKKQRKIFDVTGPRIEQIVRMTDLEDREGQQRIYHYLSRLGIKNELRKQGANPGDRIRIAGKTIIYKEI